MYFTADDDGELILQVLRTPDVGYEAKQGGKTMFLHLEVHDLIALPWKMTDGKVRLYLGEIIGFKHFKSSTKSYATVNWRVEPGVKCKPTRHTLGEWVLPLEKLFHL